MIVYGVRGLLVYTGMVHCDYLVKRVRACEGMEKDSGVNEMRVGPGDGCVV